MSEQVNFTKSSRASTTREKETRRKPWAPPSRLEAPPAPAGFKYRWLRAEIQGFEDKQNIYSKLREGYELVKHEELPEEFQHTMPFIEEGRYKGTVGIGGLILAKIPLETVAERDAYYNQKAKDQILAVDNDLMNTNAHSSMKFAKPERNSRVSFGGPRGKSGD
jgi:hypothetical protein